MNRPELLILIGAPSLCASLDFARAVEEIRCCAPPWPLQTVILDQTDWLDADHLAAADPEHFLVLTARLGVMVMELLPGPVDRGVRRVSVVLPSLHLAPVSWALQEHFRTAHGLRKLLQRARVPLSSSLHTLVSLLYRVEFLFPTLPEVILEEAGPRPVLPVGPAALHAIFRRAARRLEVSTPILEFPRHWMSVLSDPPHSPSAAALAQLTALRAQLAHLPRWRLPDMPSDVRLVDGWYRATPRAADPELHLLARAWAQQIAPEHVPFPALFAPPKAALAL